MIQNTIRIFVLAFLFIIMFVKDIPNKKIFKNSTIQLFLAFFVLIILMLFDNITGLLLAFCLLAIYFKVYYIELKNKNKEHYENSGKCTVDKCSLDNSTNKNNEEKQSFDNKHITQIPYTTEEHLISAQNNIYCADNYDKEIYGIDKGLYNENVYGVQGLDNKGVHMKGFDEIILGNMHYSIIE
jgi:Ca2+/Na+ antiporter